jgi:hypothetical protein
MSKEAWEEVAEGTHRLGVDGGYLYRVAGQLAFVPTAISSTFDEISESLWALKTLIEEATKELHGSYSGVRAFRMSNIGD